MLRKQVETPRLGCEPSGGGRISSAPIHRAALISRPRPGERWGDTGPWSKRRSRDTVFKLFCCCASVAWETDSGGLEVQTSTYQPVAMLFSGACWQAGRMDRSEVLGLSVCGCCAAQWHWWSAEEICLAWRGDMPDWSTIRGPSG
jgi:hypothetical protein